MMLYILRFAEELRDPAEYFGKVTAVKQDASQLNLAKQLIKSYERPLELDKFTDDYEAAVKELVEAKLANKPLPKEKPAARGKVVDLMSALRQSLAAKPASKTSSKASGREAPAATSTKRKLKLVHGKRSKTA
jgi:DNA end-binding protein Ku